MTPEQVQAQALLERAGYATQIQSTTLVVADPVYQVQPGSHRLAPTRPTYTPIHSVAHAQRFITERN